MISKRMKAIAAVTAAAIALTCAGHGPAFAGAASGVKQTVNEPAANTPTEFSSRNRYGYYRGYNNNAAAAAMVGAIISGVAAYAAAREYRKARERSYYGYGPYAPQPYGYSPYY